MKQVDVSAYEAAYRGARERICALVAQRADATNRVAPATPEWTARHVRDRRGRTIDELLQEWEERGSAVEAMVDSFGEAGGQLVTDVVTHEHDIRACTFGSGGPVATLRTARFEIVRAATGRRSRGQIAAYTWEGDARHDLLVLGPFAPRASAIAE